jgi:two-component system NtrC family sensor kinase
LGLAITYGIVKKMGGDIKVKSKKGEGTIFTVYLPKKTKIGSGE